jgi:hypothetical protein
MLIIRKEQLVALGRVPEREFVRKASAYLYERYPEICNELGSRGVRDSVELALSKREEYRFKTEDTILLFLDCMYLLGFEFDKNDMFPWVNDILTDFEVRPRTRMLLLLEQAIEEKKKGYGG